MAKNNRVYKEFIFEHTVSVVEHIINNTLNKTFTVSSGKK